MVVDEGEEGGDLWWKKVERSNKATKQKENSSRERREVVGLVREKEREK